MFLSCAVTKYLVYNARKRGGDSAAMYFQRTESIAGVKDMRFQGEFTNTRYFSLTMLVSMPYQYIELT